MRSRRELCDARCWGRKEMLSRVLSRVVHTLQLTGVLAGLVLSMGTAIFAAEQPPIAPAPLPPLVAVPEPGDETAPPATVPSVPPKPPAAKVQPPTVPPRVTPPPPTRPSTPDQELRTTPAPSLDQFAMRTRGTPSLRLASVPNMLGDFGMPFPNAIVDTAKGDTLLSLPLAGAGLRGKVSENNKALPMDRVYFQYNHFHNAGGVDFDITTSGDEFANHVDRYTVGLEKTFWDRLWSVDLRMPFAGSQDFSQYGLDVSGGCVGNLDVIVKRLLTAGDQGALAAGIGINTPTGSDVEVSAWRQYSLENEAVHLSPFLGALYRPNERIFYHGFLEVDVPLNGNTLLYDPGTDLVRIGLLTEQTLLKVDVSAGRWLYRNPHAYVTGLASIVEFHYTSTLNDGDVLYVGADRFGNLLNRFDLAHLTVGLHARILENTTLRVGGVFPLNDVDRAFDAEVQVSLNRYF